MVNPANGANSDTLDSALPEAQMRGQNEARPGPIPTWIALDDSDTLEVGVASLSLALEPAMPAWIWVASAAPACKTAP